MLQLLVSFVVLFALPAWAENCQMKMDKKSIKVEWTGYKFTEKEGVTGKFEKVKVTSSMEGADIHSVVKDIK